MLKPSIDELCTSMERCALIYVFRCGLTGFDETRRDSQSKPYFRKEKGSDA